MDRRAGAVAKRRRGTDRNQTARPWHRILNADSETDPPRRAGHVFSAETLLSWFLSEKGDWRIFWYEKMFTARHLTARVLLSQNAK